MLRRSFLFASTALGGCAKLGQTFNTQLGQVVADVGTIAQGLKGVLPAFAATAGISPSTVSTVTNAITDLQTVATQVQGVATVADAQPLIMQIEGYVNTIVTAVAGLPLPPPISTAFQAAAILLPIIETAVGLVVNAKSPAAGVRASAPAMSPDAARLILKASGH